VIAASAVAVQASSLEDAACSLKKGGCDGKEIELNKLLLWVALHTPTFCTVLQVLLLNDKLLGDLVRKTEAMKSYSTNALYPKSGNTWDRIPTHIR
jgi:hypothetical protein